MKKYLLIPLILMLLLSACAGKKGLPADGTYTVEVTLSGGSGRASVESPAKLSVKEGAAVATVVWSSPFYEWMEADGVRYDPVRTEGGAAFELPVPMDTELPVSAQTVAMSEPHVVEYTLYFDSSTIKAAE